MIRTDNFISFFRTGSKSFLFLLILGPIFFPLASLSFSPPAKEPLPVEIAIRLENKLKSLTSLEADFQQYYYSSGLEEPLVGRGKVFIRRPDRMRWEYDSPEKQIFIYKDKYFWLYYPEDKQLIKNAGSSEVQESEILGLLSGDFSIVDRYQVTSNPFPTSQKGVYQIKLTPREESQFSYILLEIDRESYLLLKAVFFEPTGSKLEYHFSRIKLGQKMPDRLFELKIPPDCQIIESGPIK
ncbi:MAG: LolA family protein [Candidatus Saccharicenans sp.]